MAFTYSGNPGASNLDRLRFLIGDTKEIGHILEDEELTYLIDTYTTSENALLAALYRQCANTYGAKMVKRKLGPQSEDATDRQAYFVDLANKYEKLLTYAGVPPTPDYAAEKVFDKDMMANV
jgi:hypothetical protein